MLSPSPPPRPPPSQQQQQLPLARRRVGWHECRPTRAARRLATVGGAESAAAAVGKESEKESLSQRLRTYVLHPSDSYIRVASRSSSNKIINVIIISIGRIDSGTEEYEHTSDSHSSRSCLTSLLSEVSCRISFAFRNVHRASKFLHCSR